MRFLLAILLLSLPAFARAQAPGAGAEGAKATLAYKLHLHAGRMLPFGIFGVRDIYPYWGLRFGHPWSNEDVEWNGMFIHARGVRMFNGSVSLGFPNDLEGFKFI